MALTKTTKLQAINTMLSTVGEPPVNSLSAQRADSLIAQNILDEISREVLTYGWQFNTDEDVVMTPDTGTGFIYISDKTVRVDMDRSYSNYDIVVRGNRLYNRKTNSYVFTESIKVIQIYLMEFEEMPETAKRYITIRSARVFQDRMVGSEKNNAFTLRDEVAALAAMTEYENEVGDYTIFDSPDVWRTFIREGSYRVT
jgi:hypothetical protein